MASEEQGELADALDPQLRDWLDERAAELDTSREAVLGRIVAAVRALDADGEPSDGTLPAPYERRFEELDAEFTELLEDVRERVIQVKRETDRKAPADHDHEDLAERLATLSDRLDDVEADLSAVEGDAEQVATLSERVDEVAADLTEQAAAVDEVESELAAVDDRVDEGFENYEDVLEYLTDTTDELERRLDVLARAVVDVRGEVRRLGGQSAARAEAERLKLAANRSGVRSAACADCGASVDIALLTRPECPQCASSFSDVEPKQGLFGSHTLTTGEPPALRAADEADLDDELDDLVGTAEGDAE